MKIDRISIIINKLQSEEEIFQDIDKDKILKIINESSLNLSDISDEELVKRIKRILAIEAMSGILKDLSKEQIEIFNDDIKRSSLFK